MVDEEIRERVLELSRSGLSVREIAKELPISKSSAGNIIKETRWNRAEPISTRQKQWSREPERIQTKEPNLEGLLEADKKQIKKLEAKKVKKELELEISKIQFEILKTEQEKRNLIGSHVDFIKLLIQICCTLIAYERSFNDTNYQIEATKAWKALFRMLKTVGDHAMFREAISELCEQLSLSLEEFSNPEWLQDYGLDVSDLKGI